MSEETGRTTRTYTEEYKKGAVKLARDVGRKKAAAELGIPENTLNGRLMKARAGKIDLGAGSRTPTESMTLAAELKAAREEIKRLTKESAKKQETIDFLTEATAFFAASRRK
jgi:transposase